MRSKRAGARREMLRRIKKIKATVVLLQGWWTTDTTVFVDPPDRKPGENVWLRERGQSEYPENQRSYWSGTVGQIDELIMDLRELRAYAVEQYGLTPESGAAQTARRLAEQDEQ